MEIPYAPLHTSLLCACCLMSIFFPCLILAVYTCKLSSAHLAPSAKRIRTNNCNYLSSVSLEDLLVASNITHQIFELWVWLSSLAFVLTLCSFFLLCRGCPKVYHPSCVNRDEAFFRAKGKWNCGKCYLLLILRLSWQYWIELNTNYKN